VTLLKIEIHTGPVILSIFIPEKGVGLLKKSIVAGFPIY